MNWLTLSISENASWRRRMVLRVATIQGEREEESHSFLCLGAGLNPSKKRGGGIFNEEVRQIYLVANSRCGCKWENDSEFRN